MSVPTVPHAKSQQRPKVGVAVFITSPDHPNCVLLGKRLNSLGAGLYAPPGGHLEFGEELEECGRRETLEETGLQLLDVRHEATINVIWQEADYHYIDIVLKATIDKEYMPEPVNAEPHKCEGWEWFEWDSFPPYEMLFKPLQAILDSGYSPFATKQ